MGEMASQRELLAVIAEFETADEIAAFLRKEKIQGCKDSKYTCPLAKFFGNTDGNRCVSVHLEVTIFKLFGEEYRFDHTPAMREFVKRFDAGKYPLLDEKTKYD